MAEDGRIQIAQGYFDEIAQCTLPGVGITRPSCVMPVTVEEPGGRTGDDDEQPDDIGTNRAVRKAVDELRDVLDKNGATLTVHSPTDDGVVDNDYAPDADGAAVPVKAAKKEKAQKVPASAKPKKTKGA